MTRKADCVAAVRFDKVAEFVEETAAQKWRPRILIGGAVFVVAVAIGGGWLWQVERSAAREKTTHRAGLAAAETRLTAARTAAAETNLPGPEQIRRLEALATVQRQLADMQPADFSALLDEVRRTESRINALRGGLARQRSVEEEQAARDRLTAGDTAGGAERLREALRLQHEINGSAQDSGRNFDRELRLQRELAELTAEPKQQAVEAKTKQARAALAAERWEDALGLFREARELQDQLNREFPRTRYSDLTAIARFDAEIASLTADGLDAQVSEHVQRARELRTGGRADEAVRELVEAAAAQRQLNERFEKSRFVSMERLETIEADRQTLLAEEPLRLVRTKEAEARDSLRRRRIFQAQQSVREAAAAMEDVRARLPKARERDDEMRAALAFLNLHAGDLAALQDRCYDQFAPLGTGARAMLRTEVLQEDFAKLMSSNPSRNPGRALPVDSVTYPEAEEYVRRLSWVLGRRVRLPTEEDMRAATVTDGSAAPSAEDARAIQNLSGGLAEWIASSGGRENANAAVWAGAGEVASAPRTERARTRGFRVVVEVDLARLGQE
ncbi:MAG: SUMF1/EgtB/PvdO family nonheme iron enzyme [Opitutae bacterium]|nr:SUMF1/EgtB/PvdO family nonheme iron enzyme [Opitutae bacterium]